jgi:hypothetical protein
MNISFQNKFDDINDHTGRAPGTIHKVTVLISVIDRYNPSNVLMDSEVTLYFYNENLYIGGQDETAYYDHAGINYWVRNRALSYFCYLNYDEKPQDVIKFIEVTKNKTWCFDSVVLSTEKV